MRGIPFILITFFSVALQAGSDPYYERNDFSGGPVNVPNLWGQWLVGSDLSRNYLEADKLHPVRVVVSDGGVYRGAIEKIAVELPEAAQHSQDMRFLESISKNKKLKMSSKLREVLKRIPQIYDEMSDPHGTHVAGIIGADRMDFGVSSLAQILDMNVYGTLKTYGPDTFAKALENLASEKIDFSVVNMSHGLFPSERIENALRSLIAQDKILVAAVGNSHVLVDEKLPLFQVKEIVAVGAFGSSGVPTYFSNFGSVMDIVAPGENILSRGSGFTHDGEILSYFSGTSMAAPFVSGTLATLRAILPEARAEDLQTILFRTAWDLGARGKDAHFGNGLLNTYKATLVARRLRQMGLDSRDTLQFAAGVSYIYQTEDFARAARIELRKLEPMTSKYHRALRKMVLASADPQALAQLGAYYRSRNYADYGFGLEWASLNRSDTKIPEDLSSRISQMIALQNKRVSADDRDWSLLNGLANDDAILEVFQQMPDEWLEKTDILLERLQVVNPVRVDQLWIEIEARSKSGGF